MRIPASWIMAAAVVACTLIVLAAQPVLAGDPPRYSAWSEPVNLGSTVNSSADDGGACVAKDGLSLYFQTNRTDLGGFGGSDLYVIRRARKTDAWGPPVNLGPNVNGIAADNACALSADEHLIYFQSSRAGGFGGVDLYVARRHNKKDDSTWQPARNVGSPINTAANEFYVGHHEDDVTGAITLFLGLNNPPNAQDIYASTLQADETWSVPVPVTELNTPYFEGQVAVRRDGLEMFFSSNRPGTVGQFDIWSANRASTTDPWSAPTSLGDVVNLPGYNQGHPAISGDGTALYFYSNRPGTYGGLDLWVSTRTKLKD